MIILKDNAKIPLQVILKKLVVGKNEPVLDFFFGEVGGAASFFAFEFVVALPYDTAVLITV